MVMGLVIGLIQLVVGLFVSMGAVYIGMRSFDKMTEGIDEMKEIKKGNVAVAIVMVAVILAIANVVQGGVENISRLANPSSDLVVMMVGLVVGIVQLLISIGVAVFTINIAIKVLDRITVDIDEMAELKKGNVAVALMMAGVLMAVSFVIRAGVAGLTSAIDPVSLASQLY